VVIFDLEDAVAPGAKASARDLLFEELSYPGALPASPVLAKEVVIRVNGLRTPWILSDMDVVRRLSIQGILFPKIETAEDVRAATAHMRMLPFPDMWQSCRPKLWCMIETPLAVLNVATIAAATEEPEAEAQIWVAGTNDLRKGLRSTSARSRDTLEPYLAMMLLAARAYGIDILDGVYNDIRDMTGFVAACETSAAMGFDGKTVIHPTQVAASNLLFSPSAEMVERARVVVAAFARPENADVGVLTVEGSMVERLHEEIAQRTLRVTEAIAEREQSATLIGVAPQ
jgi:citrate lyase subunit beta/citryl-CoA lyase